MLSGICDIIYIKGNYMATNNLNITNEITLRGK